ncbi:MFS transporter [Acidisphaera sp. L21]|uniref:MFS transporter n=1 Tax=Acidisphaera sp. L21 TaxID=1641851 RepID=UPI00131D78D2|nr:MFS transporter [Acidisphaera sp. L21]
MSDITVQEAVDTEPSGTSRGRRTLALAGLAHALHDGYTSSIYVLLPIWQSQFALGYGAMAVLRALYVGSLALLQVPSTRLARLLSPRAVLALGTLLSAFGYALAGFSGGLVGLCVALALAGAGSSTQHPLASAAVSRAYGRRARGPLGSYNFAGDLGKASLPPLLALLITVLAWRHALWLVAGLGAVVALLIQFLMPQVEQPAAHPAAVPAAGKGKGGFGLLLAIGMLDGAAGVTFLLFLPALLKSKGASLPTLGVALALIFIGGACGKAACGWLGAKLGLLGTVVGTELGTAAAIFAVLALPLAPTLILFPFLGIALNGTSSVLYGTVPELVDGEKVEHAFAVFYSGTLGSSALVPVLLGTFGDWVGPSWATAVGASAALCVIPLMVLLAQRLDSKPSPRGA